LERRFNLSTQALRFWLKDHIKSQVLAMILFWIAVVGFYFFLKKTGNLWWLYLGIFWLFLSLILSKITPNFIIPLFYKYKILENPQLLTLIKEYFKKIGAYIDKIYIVDFSKKTKKAGAFICGWGRNRRVVLSDTLVEKFTPHQILAVIGHEYAHIKHKDILRETFISVIFVLGGLYLLDWILIHLPLFDKSIWRFYTLPLYMLFFFAFMFIINPIVNAFSRYFEKQADIFSLKTTQDKKSFITLMEKLAQENLAEFKPPLWKEILFYTHPPIYKRIKLAENMKL